MDDLEDRSEVGPQHARTVEAHCWAAEEGFQGEGYHSLDISKSIKVFKEQRQHHWTTLTAF